MSDITLSRGVRSNLLALQNTASLLATTQERLATGKRVNSALDNPTNFFTASSLNSRAGDLNRLLDAIGNGVQTIRAADQGIKSLTKLVESAQATARQALQASQGSVNYAVSITGTAAIAADVAADGTGTTTFADDAVAQANTGNIAADAANNDALGGVFGTTATALSGLVNNNDVIEVTIGGTTRTVAISDGGTYTGGGGITPNVTLDRTTATVGNLITAIDAITNGSATLAGGGSNQIQIRADTASDGMRIRAFRAGALSDAALTAFGFTASTTSGNGGVAGQGVSTAAGTRVFTANDDLEALVANGRTLDVQRGTDAAETVTFGLANVTTRAGLVTALNNLTRADATLNGSSINIRNTTTTDFSNNLVITGSNADVITALGLGSVGTGTATARTVTPVNLLSQQPALSGQTLSIKVGNGTERTITFGTGSGQVFTKTALNTEIDSVQGLNTTNSGLTTGGASALRLQSATVGDDIALTGSAIANLGLNGAGYRTTNATIGSLTGSISFQLGSGTTQRVTFGTGSGQVSTRAQLNTALQGLNDITASLNGTNNVAVTGIGRDSALTIGGDTNVLTALGVTAGTTQPGQGSVTTASSVRSNLQADFNNLVGQIDRLAKDASFNGVNLLDGDDLKVIFNEDGSSKLEITGVIFNASGLGVSSVTNNGFQFDKDINDTLTKLDGAISTLRSQASKFGSNLSVVQTRQDFTKSLVNVLRTGADNLTLADQNEEAANLLALQTRQQLASTSLSLANQADQGVLRLF
jgi:hypothetical protein